MAFVLDISGSMEESLGSKTRLEVLGDTVEGFFDEIERQGDDVEDDVRIGMWAYNGVLRFDHSAGMAYGWDHVMDKAEDFNTAGGTLPHEAMEMAVTQLISDRATSGVTSREIIIYMTDGEVGDHLVTTGKSSTQRTEEACDAAKAEGMEIFAIGLGLTPAGEPLLQYCATPGTHPDTGKPYFYSAQTENDFEYAFKAASLGETDIAIRLK